MTTQTAHSMNRSATPTTTVEPSQFRRTTGWLLIISALSFAAAATVLSSTFEWPDILREPAAIVLPSYVDGGTSLTWTWFAVAWTYGLLAIPMLLLPAALGRRHDVVLRTATTIGVASVLLSVIGFLRWVFVVPPLAREYVAGDVSTREAIAAAWTAQHQFGGALLGEHLGEILAIAWSVTIALVVLRHRILPAWVGVSGVVVSVMYFLNQGDIMATAIPGFPVWDLAGLVGSTRLGSLGGGPRRRHPQAPGVHGRLTCTARPRGLSAPVQDDPHRRGRVLRKVVVSVGCRSWWGRRWSSGPPGTEDA